MRSREILDLTRPLGEGVPIYPGDARPIFQRVERDGYTCTNLRLTTHTGTHLDAPSHSITGGISVDRIPLQNLIGKVRVLDLEDAGDAITAASLSGKLHGGTRILIRTRASEASSFGPEFPHLTIDAARFLADTGTLVVGIDSPSIEAPGGDGSLHRKLLGSGISILELLDLSGVAEGDYFMVALPLRLEGLDGSPARVILMENEVGMA
ncbi:MAG: cyclase family protein [Methanomicrobiales archaeon]|jgi:arylformamidase